MQRIESDVNQADSRLAVKFYKLPQEDKYATQQAGRPIFKEVDYLQIIVPGEGTTEVHKIVTEQDKMRFPIQWQRYVNSQGANEHYEGTPLTEWTILNKAQVEELRALRFYTIEQVATASDQQLTKLNMAAGMSPFAFRDKAIAYLRMSKDAAEINKHEEEMAKLKAENDELNAKLAKLANQMDMVLSMQEQKKPRGRKPKEEAEITEE